jgi:hypothetical protein
MIALSVRRRKVLISLTDCLNIALHTRLTSAGGIVTMAGTRLTVLSNNGDQKLEEEQSNKLHREEKLKWFPIGVQINLCAHSVSW